MPVSEIDGTQESSCPPVSAIQCSLLNNKSVSQMVMSVFKVTTEIGVVSGVLLKTPQ